jgi:hypothetical protein
MPSYQVIAPGFMHGQTYHPEGPRNVCVTDKPLKKVPSWLRKLSDKQQKAAPPAISDKEKGQEGVFGFFNKAKVEQGKSVDL